MTILKTKADVDNLHELQRRKAELKIRLNSERAGLQTTLGEIRSNIVEPTNIVGSIVRSLIGMDNQPGDNSATKLAANLRQPLKLAADIFVRDPRAAFLLKFAIPLAVAYIPRLTNKVRKANLYGALRKGVKGVRGVFRKKADAGAKVDNG